MTVEEQGIERPRPRKTLYQLPSQPQFAGVIERRPVGL